jgi:His/Glu/Gln/Arg/opine family amino acid ABC transporter permease subunit
MRTLGPDDIIYIIAAVRWTLLLSLVAFLGGGIGGMFVALARTGVIKWLRLAAAGYIKVFQGTPLLMQLFLAFFAPGLFGWSVDPWMARLYRPFATRQRFPRRDMAWRDRSGTSRPVGSGDVAWHSLLDEDEIHHCAAGPPHRDTADNRFPCAAHKGHIARFDHWLC